MKSCYILSMRVDDVTYDEALALIDGYVKSGGCHRVVTPNPEFAMAARRDPAFLDALNGSSLAIPDGIGLMLAARLSGFRFRQHVRGTDLVQRVAALSARLGYRMFLLGAEPGVAETAASALVRRNPGLRIAGTFAGHSRPDGDSETVAAVRAAAPVDVLLVAYGGGPQEKWLVRNQQRAGVPCGIGVGGVFDFLSGRSKRAPSWVRRLELEWLYRLLTEPRRWRRQLALPAFGATVMWESLAGRTPVVVAGYRR